LHPDRALVSQAGRSVQITRDYKPFSFAGPQMNRRISFVPAADAFPGSENGRKRILIIPIQYSIGIGSLVSADSPPDRSGENTRFSSIFMQNSRQTWILHEWEALRNKALKGAAIVRAIASPS
jgi:hypothetical protein